MAVEVQITPTAAGYKFEWPTLGLVAKATHVKESRGSPSAEVVWEQGQKHLYGSNLGLRSPTSKKTLREELKRRFEAEWWGDIIELLTTETLERYRQGEPVLEITTEDEVTKPEYLLHPLLMLNHPTVIFGLKGTTKSLLSLLCGIIVKLPMPKNSFGMRPLASSTPVLFVDYEADEDVYRWRLKCLEHALGFGYLSLIYGRLHIPLADDIGRLREIVNDKNIGLVIVDSLAPACGGIDLNNSEPAIRYFNALRSLKVTSLTLAHTSKNPLSKDSSIYGTVFFTNLARSIWELKKEKEGNDTSLEVGLYHREANYSENFKPMGFKVTFGKEDIAIERDDDNTVLQNNRTNSEKILHRLLNHGAMTAQELISETDITENTLKATLSQMKKHNKVVQLGDKKWGASTYEKYPPLI